VRQDQVRAFVSVCVCFVFDVVIVWVRRGVSDNSSLRLHRQSSTSTRLKHGEIKKKERWIIRKCDVVI
jgi:hypothetical protein